VQIWGNNGEQAYSGHLTAELLDILPVDRTSGREGGHIEGTRDI
jgi:hypothetical protein